MPINIPATNYSVLEKEYDEIQEVRKGASGLPSQPPGANRNTIIFTDGYKLSCQEFVRNGFIDFFHYDYYDPNGNIIVKFHSEEHPKNPEIMKMDGYPYHIHVKENQDDLGASRRIPFPKNLKLHDLLGIIDYLLLTKKIYVFAPERGFEEHRKPRNKRTWK